MEFEVKNREKMLKISREIRTKFKELIKEFEVVPLFHEYKYNFFPRDYNSALEIKKLCLQKIGQELSEFKPVEISLATELNKDKVCKSSIIEAGSSLR